MTLSHDDCIAIGQILEALDHQMPTTTMPAGRRATAAYTDLLALIVVRLDQLIANTAPHGKSP